MVIPPPDICFMGRLLARLPASNTSYMAIPIKISKSYKKKNNKKENLSVCIIILRRFP